MITIHAKYNSVWTYTVFDLVKHSDVAPTSSGRHVRRQRVVIQFLTSGRRPTDVSDWSSRRIDDLCDRQRATSSLRQLSRALRGGGRELRGQTRQHAAWQAPARLTIARCACTASRQILDDWRNWTPSDQHLHASTSFAGCSKVGYISTETDGRKDNEYYIYTSV